MDFVRFLAATITPGAIGYDSPITNASTFLARA